MSARSARRTISLVYVVRNEEMGIRSIVPQVPLSVFDECFAIVGTSKDNTVQALDELGIAYHHQVEPGLGSAMLEARALVRTDAFVFYHPDGNENPAELPRMAELLRAGHDFVVASRMIPGAINEEDDQLFKWRKWANQGFAILANLFFAHGGNRTTDVTNGFRGITCAAFDRMRLTSRDLTMDYQMVIRALKTGIKINEFPTHEGSRISGDTNFASISTGIAELKLLLREAWLHFTGDTRRTIRRVPTTEPMLADHVLEGIESRSDNS